MRNIFWTVLTAAGLGGAAALACGNVPADLNRPRATINSVQVKAVATQLLVIASFKAGANTTELADTAAYSGGKAGHVLAGTVTLDTLILPLPTASTTGTFSLWAGNTANGWNATPAKASWSYTAPVVLLPSVPPSPTLVAHTTSTQLWLVATLGTSTNATSLADSAGLSAGGGKVGHSGLAPTTTKDSLPFTLPTVVTSYWFCYQGVNSSGASGTACNSLSYTPPASLPVIDSIRLYPQQAVFDTINPVGTTYALSADKLTEKSVSGRAATGSTSYATVQFCSYVHAQGMGWGRVSNDTGIVRCDNLFAALALSPKLAKTKVFRELRIAGNVWAPGAVMTTTTGRVLDRAVYTTK